MKMNDYLTTEQSALVNRAIAVGYNFDFLPRSPEQEGHLIIRHDKGSLFRVRFAKGVAGPELSEYEADTLTNVFDKVLSKNVSDLEAIKNIDTIVPIEKQKLERLRGKLPHGWSRELRPHVTNNIYYQPCSLRLYTPNHAEYYFIHCVAGGFQIQYETHTLGGGQLLSEQLQTEFTDLIALAVSHFEAHVAR